MDENNRAIIAAWANLYSSVTDTVSSAKSDQDIQQETPKGTQPLEEFHSTRSKSQTHYTDKSTTVDDVTISKQMKPVINIYANVFIINQSK